MIYIVTKIYYSMNPSNFQKVTDFNKQFGVTLHEEPVLDIFDKDPKLIEYRMKLIREEVGELEEAVKNKDYKETVDALSDILYVVYGMGCSIGCDLDAAFDIVHRSNMSKMCINEEEAKETVKWYESQKDKLGYDSPTYRKSFDGKYFVVYNKSTCKVLKSINYQEVDFSDLLKEKKVKE